MVNDVLTVTLEKTARSSYPPIFHSNPAEQIKNSMQTGRPNVDWCESHRPETVRANVIGTLNLADLCSGKGIHCTIYATG